jgi:hypothetical protein
MSALDIRSPVFSVGTGDRICVFSLLLSPASGAGGLTIKHSLPIRFYCGILEGIPARQEHVLAARCASISVLPPEGPAL